MNSTQLQLCPSFSGSGTFHLALLFSGPAEALQQALCCLLVAPAGKGLSSESEVTEAYTGTLRKGAVGEET